LLPLQSPVAVQEVASVEVHFKVKLLPQVPSPVEVRLTVGFWSQLHLHQPLPHNI